MNEIKEGMTKNDPRKYSFSPFPYHDRINTEMVSIVSKNIQSSEGHMHARETLDDVIDDLIQYRDSIATVEEYLEKNYL